MHSVQRPSQKTRSTRDSVSNLDIELHHTCANADVVQVRQLIEAGAYIDRIIGPPGRSDYSINTAAKTGSTELVGLLLEHGSTIRITTVRNAACRCDLNMLQFLLVSVKTYQI